MVRRPRLRAVPARRPWHGVVGRGRDGRVHRRGDAGRLRRRRMAGFPAVVQRRRRDVGHLVRRVHVDPSRGAPAAASPRDRAGHGHRRPLPRRRPLPGWLRDRERALAVRGEPGGDERDAAGRLVPGGSMARRVAGPAGGHAAVAVRLASQPEGWPVLAPGFARAGLRRDRGADLQHRGLARLVCRSGVPDAGALPGAVTHARRELGAFLATFCVSLAEPRRASRDRAVLRPASQRGRERVGGRARGRLVRTRVHGPRRVPGVAGRPLARVVRVPASFHRRASLGVRSGLAGRGRLGGRGRRRVPP